MPRRKRSEATLTQRQIQILLTGQSSAAGRGFVGGEDLEAWTRHRETLLAMTGSTRPHAYLKFELSEETPTWIEAALLLFRRKACFAECAEAAESNSPTMAADQPAELWKELETPEGIRALDPDLQDLERLLREFGYAEAWHRFRDRAQLAAKYSRIGAAIRQVLRESLTILKPKEQE